MNYSVTNYTTKLYCDVANHSNMIGTRKIAADLTHLANFRDHLTSQLMLIDINPTTAINLVPHLKAVQLNAMSNGDDFVTILPEFEIYRMYLSHGRDSAQVTTDVLGVKCTPCDT